MYTSIHVNMYTYMCDLQLLDGAAACVTHVKRNLFPNISIYVCMCA